MAKAGWVTLGQITRVRGLKGELVILPWSDKKERFSRLEEVFLGEDKPESFRVKAARVHKKQILLKLEGIENPGQAKAWIGALVQMALEQLPELAEDEYYVHDLLEFEVYSEDGDYLGQLKEIIANPGNDIFRVTGSEKELYIPATKEAVLNLDLKNKNIRVKKDLVVEQ